MRWPTGIYGEFIQGKATNGASTGTGWAAGRACAGMAQGLATGTFRHHFARFEASSPKGGTPLVSQPPTHFKRCVLNVIPSLCAVHV